MPTLENTDASLTSGAPFLKLFEPALLLPLLACGTLGGVTGNRDPARSHLLRLGFISSREEARIRRDRFRCASKRLHLLFQGGYQQSGVGGPLIANLVRRDDLVLGLLDLEQLSKLVG